MPPCTKVMVAEQQPLHFPSTMASTSATCGERRDDNVTPAESGVMIMSHLRGAFRGGEGER
eukprot:2404782-Pyramimonas_sp.AAC.1